MAPNRLRASHVTQWSPSTLLGPGALLGICGSLPSAERTVWRSLYQVGRGYHVARDAREQTEPSFASAMPRWPIAQPCTIASPSSEHRCDAIELSPLVQSRTHGLSYATFLGRLRRQGPSVLVVRDKGGFVFGCYASESWERRTRFYGDSKCFVFSLSPLLRRFPTVALRKRSARVCAGRRDGGRAGGALEAVSATARLVPTPTSCGLRRGQSR